MKPNVLIFTGSFEQGGSERQAVQLARLLHESGRFRVRVACLQPTGVLRGEVERRVHVDVAFLQTGDFEAQFGIGRIGQGSPRVEAASRSAVG